jgi:hypothetical protein
MLNKSISSELTTYSKMLDSLSKENRTSLHQLKNKATNAIEVEHKRHTTTSALAGKELEYLKQTVINLELKQLAES